MKWKLRSAGWHFAVKAWLLTGKNLSYQNKRENTIPYPFYSGVFLLQDSYWAQSQVRSKEEFQQYTFVETHNAINTLCRIASVLQQRSNMVDLLNGQCTFFLAGVAYQAASAIMTMGKGTPSAEMKENINLLRWLLQHIRNRWPLSGESPKSA